jgi:hypothetical protein
MKTIQNGFRAKNGRRGKLDTHRHLVSSARIWMDAAIECDGYVIAVLVHWVACKKQKITTEYQQ